MWLAIGVGAAGPAPSSDFPNEPAGYTELTQRPFTDYEEDGWGNNGTNDYLVPHIDSGGPISPSNVARVRFGAGRSGGTAPMNTFLESGLDVGSIYIAFGFKIDSAWQGHDSGVNKILFLTASDYGGGGDPVAFSAQGVDSAELNFQVRLQGPGTEESSAAGANIGENVGDGEVVRGTWYKIEVVMVANTSSNHDGTLDVWMNGTKTHERTDVRYFHESVDPSNHKFTVIKWNPTWGGTGDTVDTTMFQYIDHIYVSGT